MFKKLHKDVTKKKKNYVRYGLSHRTIQNENDGGYNEMSDRILTGYSREYSKPPTNGSTGEMFPLLLLTLVDCYKERCGVLKNRLFGVNIHSSHNCCVNLDDAARDEFDTLHAKEPSRATGLTQVEYSS